MQCQHIYFPKIDSTNLYLKNNHDLLSDFTFVSTDYQTQGKGRETRSWESEWGKNLLFSLLLKAPKFLEKATFFSIYMAVEIAKLLVAKKIQNVSIKWPNDVYVNDKKVCGILSESQIPNYLVIGVGLNVNQKEFPSNLRKPATSLALERNRSLRLNSLKNQLFEQIMSNFLRLNHQQYLAYFRENNYLLNKKVTINYDGQIIIGEVVGIDEHFNLEVKSDQLLLHVESGEINIDENTK